MKKILVTGAYGFIGKKLCELLKKIPNVELFKLDLASEFIEERIDISNTLFLEGPFAAYSFDTVFHLAANKYVDSCEKDPIDALHTNLMGVYNLLNMSRRYGVKDFVFASSDKAIRPHNIYGMTKAIGEKLVLESKVPGRKVARFGNVLGSTGSVVDIFRQRLEQDFFLPVTAKEMTRYVMTLNQAAQLLIGLVEKDNGIHVLEMRALRIVDLAEVMRDMHAEKTGKTVEIKFVGARPGERLYEYRDEYLCSAGETLMNHDEIRAMLSV